MHLEDQLHQQQLQLHLSPGLLQLYLLVCRCPQQPQQLLLHSAGHCMPSLDAGVAHLLTMLLLAARPQLRGRQCVQMLSSALQLLASVLLPPGLQRRVLSLLPLLVTPSWQLQLLQQQQQQQQQPTQHPSHMWGCLAKMLC
jgi:hypothetical protein